MLKSILNAAVNAFRAPPVPEGVRALVPASQNECDDLVLLKAFPRNPALVPMQLDPVLYDAFSPDPFRAI